MKPFTIVWKPDAQARLAAMWNDNPAIRQGITSAASDIERLLRNNPSQVGVPSSSRTRKVVRPPLSVLFSVSDEDCMVRVIYVKFWDD